MPKPDFVNCSMIVAPGDYSKRFKVIKRIIEEADVYICDDTIEGRIVVVKAEKIGEKKYSRLEQEAQYYQRLRQCKDFDIVLDYFIGIDHRFLILKQRGIDLRRHYKQLIKDKCWTDTLLNRYAVQMIDGLEKCHSYGIIHLDPKPNNYVLDENDKNKIHLIDFDCAKQFVDSNGQHIQYRKGLNINEIYGNRAYLSIYGHNREEQSRRDDMIFLGYSLIWMARNGLPWNIRHSTKSKDIFGFIGEEKLKYTFEDLCVNQENQPLNHLVKYMNICMELSFAEKPDYESLKSLFL